MIKSFSIPMFAAFGTILLILPAGYSQQTAAPRPVSPEIHPDRSVTFRLSAPKANEVTLNGSWEGARDIKMTKDDAGIWSVTVDPLGEQLWGYSYSVDGVKSGQLLLTYMPLKIQQSLAVGE